MNIGLAGNGPPRFSIRPYRTPGLASSFEEGRLSRDRVSFQESLCDVEALRIVEWAVAAKRAVLVCPIDPLTPMAALVAASIHIADIADGARRLGSAVGSTRRVAVITRDPRVRGTYRAMGISARAGGPACPLRTHVPAATLDHDGTVNVLDAEERRGWNTLFVTSVADLSGIDGIDVVVVDLPAEVASLPTDRGRAVVVVARDPSDPIASMLAKRIPVFGWDESDLVPLASTRTLPPRLRKRLHQPPLEVRPVRAHGVCENAALFWQDIGPLTELARRSPLGRDLARLAFGLFHDLLGLAVPLRDYETVTGSVRARIETLGHAARLTSGELRDTYLPSVELELRDLAASLREDPPKHAALIKTLAAARGASEDVMLVARTAAMKRLYESVLQRDPRLHDVRVASIAELGDAAPADLAVFTGMAPAWARWVYRAGIATRVVVLAYVPDGLVESTKAGFDEAELVLATAGAQADAARCLASHETKARSWESLTGEKVVVPPSEHRPEPAGGTQPVMLERTPVDLPPGLWDGRWIDGLGSDDASSPTAPVQAPADGRDPGALVPAVRVVFDGSRWAFLEREGVVTRLARAGQTDPGVPVSLLRVGDRIVFLDGDARKDLLAKVLEVAEQTPALAVAAGWLSHWRRVLGDAHRRHGTYEALATALHRHGCVVQAQTVRTWVIGVTIGPQDPEDVRRVGEVAIDAALLSHHAHVCGAMRALRGAHVSLGRRLADLARTVGSATAAGQIAPDEIVDERSGLTAADFHATVDVLTVRSVQSAGDVPLLLTGQLRDPEEEQA